MRRHYLFPVGVLVLAVVWGGSFADAQSGRAKKQTQKTAKRTQSATASKKTAAFKKKGAVRKRSLPAMTSAREAAAITFARLHHSELADLLLQLKKNNRPAYRQAVRELFQTAERLAKQQEKMSPPRYELALDAWKLDSRIRLLLARMTMSDDPALEAELKVLLLQRVDVRVRKLVLQRDGTSNRLKRVNAMIDQIESDREAAAFKDLQRMKRSLVPKKTKRPIRNQKPKRSDSGKK